MTKLTAKILIVMFGIFSMPTEGHICEDMTTETEISCFTMDMSEDASECCEMDYAQNEKKKCDDTCGNSLCHYPTVNTAVSLPLSSKLVISANKLNSSYSEAYVSSVFLSIWVPPKISWLRHSNNFFNPLNNLVS